MCWQLDNATVYILCLLLLNLNCVKTETNKMVPGPVTKMVSRTIPEQNSLPEFLPQEVSTAPWLLCDQGLLGPKSLINVY